MANAWDNDPIVDPAPAWANDPIIARAPAPKQPSAKAMADQAALKAALDEDNKSQFLDSLKRGAAFVVNSGNKGFAAIPDAVMNTPTNLWNLSKAAVGSVANAAGRPDLAPDLTQNPDLTHRALTAVGAINPDLEPQNRTERLLDAGVQGTVGMAVAPANSLRQLGTNLAIGGTSGLAGAATKEATGSNNLALAAGMATPWVAGKAIQGAQNAAQVATEKRNLNAVRDANIQDARDAGYAIPPSQSNPSSVVANTLDIVAGGRPKMAQAASAKNLENTQRLAARDLGLPEDTPITRDVLDRVRQDAFFNGYVPVRSAGAVDVSPDTLTGRAYHTALDAIAQPQLNAAQSFPNAANRVVPDMVAGLRTNAFDASHAVDQIKLLRAEASRAFTSGDAELGQANRSAAAALESALEDHLRGIGNTDALTNFQNARRQIAKAHAVEDALLSPNGPVSAKKLANQSNTKFLDGDLRTIADIGGLNKGHNVQDMLYATPGGSQLEGVMSAGGAIETHNPWFLGIPYARAGLRSLLLSDPVQSRMSGPDYQPNWLTRALSEGSPQSANDVAAKSALAGLNLSSGPLSSVKPDQQGPTAGAVPGPLRR